MSSQPGYFNLQEFTDAGALMVGGRVYTYIYGTTTHKTTYTDEAGAVPHTYTSDGIGGQYIALNARGEMPAPMYLATGSYDIALKTAAGATVWTRRTDPIYDVGDGGLRADLANSSDVAKGDVMIATKSTLASTIGSNQHEVNERTRHVFEWFSPTQIADAVSGAFALDLTTPCQTAINSGANLIFSGLLGVTHLDFNVNGKTYVFQNGSALIGIAVASTGSVVGWQAAYCNVYNMAIVGQFKSNYASAMRWHSSAGLPAKSNKFFGGSIDNALIGVVFGAISPEAPIDQPQSENFWYGLKFRGVERPLYNNQPNGFIAFIGGEINSSKNEWDISNPGVYDFARACAVQSLQGVMKFNAADIGKADTQIGSGITISGGTLLFTGCSFEIASRHWNPSGGTLSFTACIGGYWGNASVSHTLLSGTSGILHVDGYTLQKAAAASAANTAFVDIGAATGWEVSITNARLNNQYQLIFGNGSAQTGLWTGQNNVYMHNVTSKAVDDVTGVATQPIFQKVSFSPENLLDTVGADYNGASIATWFIRDLVGVGAIALNADVPAGLGYFNSIMVTPQVGGNSTVSSIDVTSLASVRATGIKCRPGDQYLFEGYFRMTSAGTAKVEVLLCNVAGAPAASVDVASDANYVTNGWGAKISAMFTVPANCAYFGVGIRGEASTVCRMAGLKVSKLA